MAEWSAADVLAMQKDNDGLFGGNGSGLIILLLFFLMMGGGFWNRGGEESGALTRAEMADGFNMQNLQSDVKGIYSDLTNGFANLNSNIQNGFANMQTCCCETNRNIDQVRYENAQNTCAITTAIHNEGCQTRELIVQQQIQDLRDRLQEKDNLLQSANLTLANAAQTQNILTSLGRFIPYAGCGTTCGGFSV